MKVIIACLLFISSNICYAQQNEKWGDQGDGTYRNPVLPGDYSDIDAIRVGDDYYAISSTFQYSPGMIILQSKDLVNWKILGHITDDLNRIGPALNWDKMDRYGKGIWAGAIRFYNNRFWVYFCTADEGFFMTSATDPAGPWEPLHKMWDVSGWDDCCPFWDDDGQAYLVTTHFSDNYKIHLFKITEDGREIIVVSDSVIYKSKGSEASKLYKINGIYYHFYSEVIDEGRVPMMRRAKSIYGPYETKQLMHVDQKKDKEPNQGGLIQSPSGEWWFFTHQGTGSWEGRAACLLPVTWIDGWPIPGAVGADSIGKMLWSYKMPLQSSVVTSPQTNDDFGGEILPVQWEWNYQPRKGKWSLAERKGFLRLHAFMPLQKNNNKDKRPVLFRAGNTLTQRIIRTKNSEVIIKMDLSQMADGQLAGLCHYGATYSTLGVQQNGNKRTLVYDENGKQRKGPTITNNEIWIKSYWNFAVHPMYCK